MFASDRIGRKQGGILAAVFFRYLGGTLCAVVKGQNVSSVVRTAQGVYRVNFATPLPDTTYAVLGNGRWPNNASNVDVPTIAPNRANGFNAYSTTAVEVGAANYNNGFFDVADATVLVFNPALM